MNPSPSDRVVHKMDFINECTRQQMNFEKSELEVIFDEICAVGINQGSPIRTAFTNKQFIDAFFTNKENDQILKTYLKIEAAVSNKNMKKLFAQFKDKTMAGSVVKCNAKELRGGIKSLKAGITTDELEMLLNSL
jgi:hypothetical protein